jgi:hypothetical protein
MPDVNLQSGAQAASWSLVTAFKAASSYVGGIMTQLLAARAISHVDMAQLAFENSIPEDQFCIEGQELLERPGYFFGPFRDAYVGRMPALAKTNIVVQIRDPRDCLVSYYYSVAFSHGLPAPGPSRDKFMVERETALALGLDEYALLSMKTYLPIFSEMIKIIETMPNVYVSRYEEMVVDFKPWLDRLAEYLGVGDQTDVKKAIVAAASFKVSEDQFNHKRQVTPGDFRRKLMPQTQSELTRCLEPVLSRLGYV